MSTFEDRVLQETMERLDDLYDQLDGIQEWADDEGYNAIAHKLAEVRGPLLSAAAAADQYRTGELKRRV